MLSANSPLVIVNSVCPGMVKTDIGRHIASRSWFHALCVWVTLLITAKSADSGARICVTAALKPKENHVSIDCSRAHVTHITLSTVKKFVSP